MAAQNTIINVMRLLNTQYTINKDQQAMLDLWQSFFEAVPDELLVAAVKRFMVHDHSRKTYFPNIGDICAELKAMNRERYPDKEEVWQKIEEFMKKFSREYKRGYSSLPEILQQAIGTVQELYHYKNAYTSEFDRSKIKQAILDRYETAIEAQIDALLPMANPLPQISYTIPEPPQLEPPKMPPKVEYTTEEMEEWSKWMAEEMEKWDEFVKGDTDGLN